MKLASLRWITSLKDALDVLKVSVTTGLVAVA